MGLRQMASGVWRGIWAALLLIVAVSSGSGLAQAQDDAAPPVLVCAGEISIADLGWPSASILAHIHARLLTDELGCRVRLVPGDLVSTGTAMAASGQPMVAPEMWPARIADIWTGGLEAGTVRQAAPAYSGLGGAFEGWYVPAYVAEATPAALSLSTLPAAVAAMGKKGKPAFVSCPPDWACALVNRNLLRALGLEGKVDLIEPANRFEMDQTIASAVSRKEPLVFYYWAPNAVLDQFDFTAIDMGAFDAEAFKCLAGRACAAPKVSAYAPEQVIIALGDAMFRQMPQVASYFQRASMPVDQMNALLAWQNANGAEPEAVAAHFIAENPEVWQKWTESQK